MRLAAIVALALVSTLALAADPPRVMPPGARPPDHRLTDQPRNLDGNFRFDPPSDLKTWDRRREDVRLRLLVALGLWPMPESTSLNPVVHGRIDRDDYTIDKVYFASLPGHFVTGNLYRPKGATTAKLPAVLCPHGHWANGRMHDAGEAAAKREIESGAETWNDSARYLLQAKCVQLVRMGCVVFHFDMLGYADSTAIPHRDGFTDVTALLRLQSTMGLQTWNCIRALDFVVGLPDVDAARIAVTGGSGGGTQSFILTALDSRIAASFPAVMVSTGMQGGCICENAPYLRIGTGNVEIAALCAPRPLGMTGANDWTKEIETKGLPELKALYAKYGAEDRVMAKSFPQFGHNYNQVSRELMANWLNTHLKLGLPSPIKERSFVPVPPRELSVFDAGHRRPKDEVDVEGVKRWLTAQAEEQLDRRIPSDAARLAELRRVVGPALRVMNDSLPPGDEVDVHVVREEANRRLVLLLTRANANEAVPVLRIRGDRTGGSVYIWVHPAGKASLFQEDGALVPAAQAILDRGGLILAVDVLGCGELTYDRPKVDSKYAGYTFGYNSPLLAERVRDILTVIAYARQWTKGHVHLVGWESAGPWVIIARALAGDAVRSCAADCDGFRFESVRSMDDPMMLPGALKYGGLGAFAALIAPGELLLHNHRGTGTGRWVGPAYEAAKSADRLRRESDRLPPAAVVDWLLKMP